MSLFLIFLISTAYAEGLSQSEIAVQLSKTADLVASALRNNQKVANSDALRPYFELHNSHVEKLSKVFANPFSDPKYWESYFQEVALGSILVSIFGLPIVLASMRQSVGPIHFLGGLAVILSVPSFYTLAVFPRYLANGFLKRKLVKSYRAIENIFWSRLRLQGLRVPEKTNEREPWLMSAIEGRPTDAWLEQSIDLRRKFKNILLDRMRKASSFFDGDPLHYASASVELNKLMKQLDSIWLYRTQSSIEELRAVELAFQQFYSPQDIAQVGIHDLFHPVSFPELSPHFQSAVVPSLGQCEADIRSLGRGAPTAFESNRSDPLKL